ncbi:MAG: SNF2 helicase associated domain-containing protein [Clostridia bacterium]|nr:SNF2 helicase associated domain-containing protein [Clostridia bacterium]
MLVDKSLLEEISLNATEEKLVRVDEFLQDDLVKIVKATYDDDKDFELYAKVKDNFETQDVYTKIQKNKIAKMECSCEEFVKSHKLCSHIIATINKFDTSEEYANIFGIGSAGKSDTRLYNRANQYKTFNQIISAFYDDFKEKEEKAKISKKGQGDLIGIGMKIIYNRADKELSVEVKIGDGKNYHRVKNLMEFYDNFMDGGVFKYGQKLEFKHSREMIKPNDLNRLDFILKYAELMKYTNESIGQQRYYGKVMKENEIIITNSCLDELFEVLEGKYIKAKIDYKTDTILFLDEEPDIKFKLEEADDKNYRLHPNIDIYSYDVLQGKNYMYMLIDDVLYRCPLSYKNTVLKLLDMFKNNFTKDIVFKKTDLPKLFSLVVPKIKKNFEIGKINEEEMEKYIPQELYVKLFLDSTDTNYITADVKFGYKDIEFNPLVDDSKVKVSRDVVKETKALETFINTGFMLDQQRGRLILTDDEKIYNFLSEEIFFYMKNYEVLVTDNFRKKEVKQPKISNVGIKIENNLLKIDLADFNFSAADLAEIIERYRLKKKFFRASDGSFIDLETNDTLEFLEKLNIDGELQYNQLINGEFELPVYRTLYLDKILKNSNIKYTKNKEYKDFINDIKNNEDDYIKVPANLNATMRRYQEVGYKWLKTLDNYGLGGVLADDMGLGKTLQVIAVLLDYKNTNLNNKTSIVVCPSSLALNWYSEINKFAPTLSTCVVSGSAEDRKNILKRIEDFDVIITSYDLLKRDIEEYKNADYEFKYIIADEAQYIKNNNTQNFKAIKKIKAQTRFALTGTPIENSLAELWSIFDFSMPGYLYGYKQFKETFETPIIKEEDSYKIKKLKLLIEPFILRRIKEEVLTELPDKVVTILNSEMEEEQQKLYMSYMAEAREEVANEIMIDGFEKNQMKILALLMRLRQICCHPSLFLDNYKDGSGKLNQCMQIIKDAVQGNHKILLFSGYTSMFDIIEPELEKEGIKFFKLTGQTKVSDRIKLVDEFNENNDIKVFLISLKAGGTGLNLVGADMVIHYDPWWNISAENQATDRTYRIGQKRNVQVYKLITKNSIEEKIYELQQRKAKLVDDMLSTNETFISKLSKDEIMDLFK